MLESNQSGFPNSRTFDHRQFSSPRTHQRLAHDMGSWCEERGARNELICSSQREVTVLDKFAENIPIVMNCRVARKMEASILLRMKFVLNVACIQVTELPMVNITRIPIDHQ